MFGDFLKQFGLNFPMFDPSQTGAGVVDQRQQAGAIPGVADPSVATPGGPVQLPTASATPPSSLAGGEAGGPGMTPPPGAMGASPMASPLAQTSPLAGPVEGGQPQPPDAPGASPAAGFASPFGRSL